MRNGFSAPSDDMPPEIALGQSSVNHALDGATVAFRALALARLERDHAALLAALCELDVGQRPSPGARSASMLGTAGAANGTAGDSAPASTSLRAALAVLLRDDLRQTQRALGRAATGEFGVCDTCHSDIDLRTLLVQPAVTRCAHCAAVADRARLVH